ncbi:MAG TPA: DUF2946 family protein [Noviherbaspirillum sp.]|uniref:DUF2946 family protein n=1 Tax=Noviherbaspirillum sp. TaxID=1926288 RepID=UPI002B4A1AF2|nr:DUF2946 family protein [Noviherbaspirillum sp.]HJV83971.1 DUF2946 family protein [Noviherbaspirillum sp.]
MLDDIVKQAMAKWPNVPHCYGWLALDRRGNWRMRDERAQALRLPGDRITNAALLGFINRNYTHDEQGRWYFQNGPQRVYVTLEVAPYIAHTDPAEGFVLHTREPLRQIEAAWMTEAGHLLLQGGEKIAVVDDRDMAQCLQRLHLGGAIASDEQILAWLDKPQEGTDLALDFQGTCIPVNHVASDAVASRFGFVLEPQPGSA